MQLQKTMENGKEDLVLLAKRADTRKETEKEMPKGKDPKGPSSSGESNNSVCIQFQKRQCQKGIRMRPSASTRMLTLRIPKWMQMRDTCVFKVTGKAHDDKHGNPTMAIKLGETKGCEWCIEKDGQAVRSVLK